ncbi:alkaline phosphatase family protein [Nocardioides sp.]|uniref:alkaline phosphatase family protein n=1 Tax=Nocardioides sp. TaxID=35761 RepID=UPI003D10FE64
MTTPPASLRALIAATVLAVLAGCSNDSSDAVSPVPGNRTEPQVVSEAAKPATIVVAISVDGFNPRSLAVLGAAKTPGFQRLRNHGATTLGARTAVEITKTLPNHTGMMTGRRILGPDGHHVTFNEDNGATLRSTAGHYVAGIFDVAHDRGRSTALYTSKDKFGFLVRSWDARHGALDRVGADDGRNKLTRFDFADPDVLVADLVEQLVKDPDDLSFLHLALPDAAGHDYGWMSPEYLAAVRQTDAQVRTVLRTIAGDPWLKAHTVVVLTADHGGPKGSFSHSVPTLLADYRVPFMVWGAGVAKGVGLYGLNPARKAPGSGRPSYAGRQPIRNIDVAGLVMKLLGLPQVPGGTLPRMKPLNVS